MSARPIIVAEIAAAEAALVAAGRAAHAAAVQEHGPADEWDNKVINQVITAFVQAGRPFSANDMRRYLPEVRKCLISRRLIDAQNDGRIRYVGVTASTLASTKAARVNVYAPARRPTSTTLVKELSR